MNVRVRQNEGGTENGPITLTESKAARFHISPGALLNYPKIWLVLIFINYGGK